MTETTYGDTDSSVEPDEASGTPHLDGAEDQQAEPVHTEHRATLRWLEDEFPDWDIAIGDSESGMSQELRPIWIARKDGHHPQAELSAAKLHTRLSEYLHREQRRDAMGN